MTTQLCQLASVWNFATVPPSGIMAEEKIDGWRAIYLRDWQGRPHLATRNGQAIEGVGHILNRLALMEQIAGEPMVFDGEFQVGGTLAATKAWTERGWRMGGEAGTLHLFDAMPEREWRAGGSGAPLYERKAWLAQLMAEAGPHSAVTLLADDWCADGAAVLALAQRIWARGGEGLVLKRTEAGYSRRRNGAWLKVKSPTYQSAALL